MRSLNPEGTRGLICSSSTSFEEWNAALFFESLISIPPILDAVLSFTDVSDIFRLSYTCQGALEAVTKYMRRAFNFNSYFRAFFNDPFDFRELLARTGAVVSGLNAFHYISRTGMIHEALDLYVNPNEAEAVCEWLTTTMDGYQFLPTRNQLKSWRAVLEVPMQHERDEYTSAMSDLTNNLTFVTKLDGENRRVRVKVCGKKSQPVSIAKIILEFDHSCLMNIITHHAAYCLYSSLTMRDHLSFVFEYGTEIAMRRYAILDPDSISFDKYSDHPMEGWTKVEPNALRHIGDDYCWKVPHAPHEDISTDDLMVLNEWKVTIDHEIMKTHAHSLHVLGMRHGYTRSVGVPQSVTAEKTVIAVAQKLVLQSFADERTYEGDELDQEVYAIWQNLANPEFAAQYWEEKND